MKTLISRSDTVKILLERDGNACAFPGCEKVLNKANPPTIDHWIPKAWGRENGWTEAQIESLDNKKLMCKVCNCKKSNILPNPDGTMPLRETVQRIPKVERPEICDTCFSGRLLLPGELCDDCGSDAQPRTHPKTLQRKTKECDHSTHHCVRCIVWEPEIRVPAMMRIIGGP